MPFASFCLSYIILQPLQNVKQRYRQFLSQQMKLPIRSLSRFVQNASAKVKSSQTLKLHTQARNPNSYRKCIHTSSSLADFRIVEASPYDAYGVRVQFSDGTKSRFQYIWLRDCCMCPECFDQERQHRLFKIEDLDIDIRPTAMWVTGCGDLGIKWPEKVKEHCSLFQPEWLKQQSMSFEEGFYGIEKNTKHRPAAVIWDRQILKKHELPQMAYATFDFNEEGLKNWLHLFYKYGFVILRDVPLAKDLLFEVAKRLSYIRRTAAGSVIEEQSNYHPQHLELATEALHNDLVYRERSPGIILFHFLETADIEESGEDDGGQILLSDGFFAAKRLKQKYDSFFRALMCVPVCYGHRDPKTGVYYSSYWPVIGINPLGEVEEIHHCPFTRKPARMPDEEMLTFYEALVEFSKNLDSSCVKLRMMRGDLLAVNNRRLLHAQVSLDPLEDKRHTRICYLDLDEVLCMYDAILERNGE